MTHDSRHVSAKIRKVKSKLSRAKTEESGFHKNVTHDLHLRPIQTSPAYSDTVRRLMVTVTLLDVPIPKGVTVSGEVCILLGKMNRSHVGAALHCGLQAS